MDNFEVLNHYIIPSDILMDMLATYKLLGKNEQYQEALRDQSPYLYLDTLEKDTFFATKLLKMSISENRLRLIILEKVAPKNKEEEVVLGIKKVFIRMHDAAKQHLSFNSSDMLDNLNLIFGKRSTSFSPKMLQTNNKKSKPISIRLAFNQILDNYHQYRVQKKFESIYLSVITFMEMKNLIPFTKHNDCISVFYLYYMLILSDVLVFEYVSFMELYYEIYNQIEDSIAKGSLNYYTNYLQTSDTTRLIFKLINQAYKNLDIIVKNISFNKRAYKSDVIEETIYKKVPKYFTKEDIRKYHPDASDSTINRILFKLRDEQVIMPLGKGRSAKWMKLINDNDPRIIFGVNYEQEN